MELIKINPEQFGLSEIQATTIANKFLPVLEEMQPHLDKYAEIKDLDPADSANSKQFKELRLMFKNKAEQYLHDNGFVFVNGLYQSKKYGFSLSPHFYNDLLSYSHFSSFKNQIDRLNKEAERESELKAENERKDEAEKQRLASLAPDKDKLIKYVNELRAIKPPELSQPECREKLSRFFAKMKMAIAELG